MLQQLADHDHVEALVFEWERLRSVGPDRLDPELRRLLQRTADDVDADYLVAVQVRARERPEATADIEDAPPGSDPVAEEHAPLRPAEDEVPRPPRLVMSAVDGLELLESAHV